MARIKLHETLILGLMSMMCFAFTTSYLITSRETARNLECKNQLRQIGLSMFKFMDMDPASRFCSGAPDFRRDGSPDTFSWIADYMNWDATQTAPLCPTNPARGVATVYDLIEQDVDGALDGCPPGHLDKGAAGSTIWDGVTVDSRHMSFAGTVPKSAERVSMVARAFVAKGYNSNYVASWPLVRTQPKINLKREELTLAGNLGTRGLLGATTTLGPLRSVHIDVSPIPSRAIPLMGDGATATKAPYELSYGSELRNKTPDPFGMKDTQKQVLIRKGDPLVAAFNQGPAQWDEKQQKLLLAEQGTPLTKQIVAERDRQYDQIKGTVESQTYIQDTRNWSAVHGDRDRAANLLMADGSVIEIQDQNGDGLLNPGFPTRAMDGAARIFRDATIDLKPSQVFNGMFLSPIRNRAVFP